MIFWCIEKDGKKPLEGDNCENGCSFPDFAHQVYLYAEFNVGDKVLDEYGRTEFFASHMKRLRDRMVSVGWVTQHKPSTWTVSDSSRAGEEAVIQLDRYKIEEIVQKTVTMIDRALEIGGRLVFLGD